jgi:hypothetical protein
MEDRELLELAAKAASIVVVQWRDEWIDNFGYPYAAWLTSERVTWNPLEDDRDSLRLAVTLSLSIIHSTGGKAMVMSHDATINVTEECISGCGRYATTRRAIARAAAEIGKAMP